ncbi:23S rRNA (uracil(1939)-C(5))-methyltransferase RlmD [Amphibacillus sp. Q70]|uniref:23S rRNA (uracil(1939)-C(5))-methyltransferase RlmD n=1 Tax=Amphibacillus sp. Q70 TaxID=3453416 RepID=UPI003F85E484
MTNIEQESFETTITHIDKKGSGRAVVWRDTGQVNPKKLKLTIPQTIPGEKVKVTVNQPNRKWARVFADQIIEADQDRVEPKCPHFDLCGGCVFQHWHYYGQLKAKTDYVRQSFANQGFDTDLIEDTIGTDSPWHYRNKMEFTFAKDGSLGLHEQGNFRKIISLETCLIAGKKTVETLLEVADWAKTHELPGYYKEDHKGLLRHLMIRESYATGEMMLGLFATEAPVGELKAIADDLVNRITTKFNLVKSLIWFVNNDWADRTQAEEQYVLAGRDFIYDQMSGYRYRLWFDTFFQTNPRQAEKLVELAIEMADPKPEEKMIDLFCGVGTFSLPFANRVKALAGVEIVEASIESAKRNARDNGIDNTTFLAKDARRGIDQVIEEFGIPDLLMLDPPRSGAGGKVMRRIGRAQPSRIVYVSCNPESLAVDLKELMPFGYKIEKIQPVDLFPHTVHVEAITLLCRRTT